MLKMEVINWKTNRRGRSSSITLPDNLQLNLKTFPSLKNSFAKSFLGFFGMRWSTEDIESSQDP